MKPLTLVITALLIVGILLAPFQLYGHFADLLIADDNCDFPDVCLTTYYPAKFVDLTRIWSLSVAVSWLIVLCAVLRGEQHRTVVTLTLAGIASYASIYFTPIHKDIDDPIALDVSYVLAFVLMILAAGIYAEHLIHFRASESIDTSVDTTGRRDPLSSAPGGD